MIRACLILLLLAGSLPAQPRTQPSRLANRHRITGSGLVGKWIFGTQRRSPYPNDMTQATGWGATNATRPAANEFIDTATSGKHQLETGTRTLYGWTTATVEIKRRGSDTIRFALSKYDSSIWGLVDPVTMTAVAASASTTLTVSAVGDGWYRVRMTWHNYGTTSLCLRLMTSTATGNAVGDNTYSGTGQGIYVRRAMLLEGPESVDQETVTGWGDYGHFSESYQQVLDLSGNGNHLTMGNSTANTTNDPDTRMHRMVFVAANTDQVTGIPAKGAAWTVVNCSYSQCEAVDSAGGSYINGTAQAGATEFNIGTAGGYNSTLLARYQYSRVLTAADHRNVLRDVQRELRAQYGGNWIQRGVVSFSFDDGTETDLTTMLPVFQAHSVVGSSAIVCDWIGTAGKLTVANLGTLYAANWEFLNHTNSHPHMNSLTQAQQLAEMQTCRDRLVGWGLPAPRFIAWPFGENNSNGWAAASAMGYSIGRAYVSTVKVNLPPANAYNFSGLDADNPASQATYQSYISDASSADRGGWVVFVMHNTDAADATNVDALMTYAEGLGVPIKSLGAAWDYLQNPILQIP